MFDTYLLIGIAVAILIAASLWLRRKKSSPDTFTGNVDNHGQPKAPLPRNSSNIAPGNAEEAVRALLDAGNKIEAIQRVREQTGLGLKEAKDLVEAMERGASVSIRAGDSSPAFHGDIDSEARSMIRAGKVIEAIKLVREQKNLGLREAKDYVERL